MPTKMPETSLPVYILCLLTLSSASYVQNWYSEGKRPDPDKEIRQCLACGPEKSGHCFAPNICCGEEFGCHFGTSATQSCQEEDKLPDPCMSGWKWCGEEGRCALSRMCCGIEGCTDDAECKRPPKPTEK
ncbi:oxytocin-neurophysin 1-like [Zootoca vivipara]|uniref:oxytocin-neurophysin 1-like n=1 Tax=Zootoca vivipara TaxID=8524 RepID=UPI00293BE7CE|nr:oxytocin-neurophysin 1-like [Zootoca vivipara]